MSSSHDWVWEAFALYDTLFSYMPPFILKMNTKAQEFHVEPSKFKRFLWMCSVFFNVFVIAFSTSLYAVIKWSRHPKSMFPMQAAAALGILAVTTLIGYTCVVHYVYRKEHVQGCNSLLELHLKKLNANARKRNVKKRKAAKEQKPKRDLKQVILGRTMKGMVWAFWCIPAVVPIGIFEGIDPLRTLLLDLIPAKWMDNYPVHVSLSLLLVRFLLNLVSAMEASRFFAMFFLMFISGILIYVDCIEKFLVDVALKSTHVTPAQFLDFQSIRMIIHILNPIMLQEICCLMFTGFVIAVGSNVGIVQCYEVFPWYMYFMFVFVFIITMIIIYCTLPFGTEVNEKTGLALELWKAQVHKCAEHNMNVNLMRRKLRSLRAVSVRCGPFFKLKCETKSTYFDAIFSYSCDLNITVDVKNIFENGL